MTKSTSSIRALRARVCETFEQRMSPERVADVVARAFARDVANDDVERSSSEFARGVFDRSLGRYDADVRAVCRAYVDAMRERELALRDDDDDDDDDFDDVRASSWSFRDFASIEDAHRRSKVSIDDEACAVVVDAKTSERWSSSRYASVGVASAVAGSVLFITGAVVAPAIAVALSGLGVVGSAGAGALACAGGASAALGAAGATLVGYKMARRTSEAMEVFRFTAIRGQRTGYVVRLFVPGFLRRASDAFAAFGASETMDVVVAGRGTLGMRLERESSDRGEVVMVYVIDDDDDEKEEGAEGGEGLAKSAGVVSRSELVSARSLDEKRLNAASSSEVSRTLHGDELTIEAIEALPRPLELRLRRPIARESQAVETLVEEMRRVAVDAPAAREKVSSADALHALEMESTTWENTTGEQYVVEWETSTLIQLGAAMQFVAGKYAITAAAPKVLAHTALASIAAAVAWPATLLSASNYLDDPWTLAKAKAAIAGDEIARALLSDDRERRPVTFVSYSTGAYVVQNALQKLYDAGEKGRNIVESVVFVSAPLSCSERVWQPMREVVSGRLINVYCPNDWILFFLYRLKAIDPSTALAGLCPVCGVDVENFEIAIKHASLPDRMAYILKKVGIEE